MGWLHAGDNARTYFIEAVQSVLGGFTLDKFAYAKNFADEAWDIDAYSVLWFDQVYRSFTVAETDRINTWLQGSPNRRVIIVGAEGYTGHPEASIAAANALAAALGMGAQVLPSSDEELDAADPPYTPCNIAPGVLGDGVLYVCSRSIIPITGYSGNADWYGLADVWGDAGKIWMVQEDIEDAGGNYIGGSRILVASAWWMRALWYEGQEWYYDENWDTDYQWNFRLCHNLCTKFRNVGGPP